MTSSASSPSRLPSFHRLLAAAAAAALFLSACGGGDEPQPASAPEPQAQAEAEQEQREQPQPAAGQQQEAQAEAASEQQEQPAAEQQQEAQAQPAAEQEAAEAPQAQEQQEEAEPAADEDEEQIAPGTRIITLFGDLTEVVYALGAQEFLVARDTASIYPPEAEALPNLGFNQQLSAEGILAFSPTIIFATPQAGPDATLEHLREAGVEIVLIEEDDDLDAPAAKVRTVGNALGIPHRAEALASDIERRLDEVRGSIPESERGPEVLFLYLRGATFQFAGGEGSPSQVMIEAAGGIDAGAAAGLSSFQALTPEALVAADPEVLLLMEGGVESVGGIEGLLEIPGIAETRAGRARRFIIMDDLYLLDFGPRAPDALADLADRLRELRIELSGG